MTRPKKTNCVNCDRLTERADARLLDGLCIKCYNMIHNDIEEFMAEGFVAFRIGLQHRRRIAELCAESSCPPRRYIYEAFIEWVSDNRGWKGGDK